ncbi:CLIP domain-containing serine protease B4-like [Toxorhynchites rutilus septentrionalis]|uniref:CLIP domain-containing serine protease B4-like n=1 Tax=Toxorhynchites rutilus septentrionalis TaxID=329112 RepID=UPI00247AFF04|nr:CLIP domain-containing serine protease B4-like [Toxorhynchites rutilus septentrionalis]
MASSFNFGAILLMTLLAACFSECFHFPDKAQLELSDVLNKNCGVTAYEDRDRPPYGRFQETPWLALFYYPDDTVHFCHGTLITPNHVLTTAVCANNVAVNDTIIVLGEYDLSTDQDCEGIKCADSVQKRLVKSTTVHPDYNKDTFENDIAVVILNMDVALSESITPICLPLIKFEIGTINQPNVYNTLWTTEARPQQHWMRYVELDECNKLVGDRIQLHEGQICARSFNNKTIEMIGGAGSALEVEYHSRTYQVAMLSIGILDAEPGTPYVYVDVTKYVKWIHNMVKNN